MNNSNLPGQKISVDGKDHTLHYLLPKQIIMIDESLAAIHDSGEICLVVEKNRLRFIVTQKSFNALKWEAGQVLDASG